MTVRWPALTYTALGTAKYAKEKMELYCDGAVWALDDYKSLTVTGRSSDHAAKGVGKGHREELQAFGRRHRMRRAGVAPVADIPGDGDRLCGRRRDPGPVMTHILCVVGARPNFMKMAPIMVALKAEGFAVTLVHTGQHYDAAMNDLVFEQLRLPLPDVNLEVGSASHAQQTGEVMKRIEPVLLDKKPDAVLVVGDVNSTLAAALVAVKLGIKVIHVEAGLRSRDRAMPEEINRVLDRPDFRYPVHHRIRGGEQSRRRRRRAPAGGVCGQCHDRQLAWSSGQRHAAVSERGSPPAVQGLCAGDAAIGPPM